MDSWNICAFDTKASGVKKIKCTFLTLEFASPAASEGFETSFLDLRCRQLELQVDKQNVIGLVSRGKSPLSTKSDKMSVSSLAPITPQRTNFVLLPAITETGPFSAEFAELGTDRPTRELG